MRGRGIALLAMAAALALAGTATAAVPDDFYGVNADRVLNDQRPSAWDDQLQAIAATGIRVVRSDAFWADAEPTPPLLGMVHQWNWTGLDQRAAAPGTGGSRVAAGARLRNALGGVVPGPGRPRPSLPPRRFRRLRPGVAKRYGPGGNYWSAHPELSRCR